MFNKTKKEIKRLEEAIAQLAKSQSKDACRATSLTNKLDFAITHPARYREGGKIETNEGEATVIKANILSGPDPMFAKLASKAGETTQKIFAQHPFAGIFVGAFFAVAGMAAIEAGAEAGAFEFHYVYCVEIGSGVCFKSELELIAMEKSKKK